jgi:hypothetical protein
MGIFNSIYTLGLEHFYTINVRMFPNYSHRLAFVYSVIHWTCSITRLVIEQVLQNAPHFAIFQRKLFKNFSF